MLKRLASYACAYYEHLLGKRNMSHPDYAKPQHQKRTEKVLFESLRVADRDLSLAWSHSMQISGYATFSY